MISPEKRPCQRRIGRASCVYPPMSLCRGRMHAAEIALHVLFQTLLDSYTGLS